MSVPSPAAISPAAAGAAEPQKLGNESRSSILPVAPPLQDLFGPDYSYADELPMPDQIGVRSGGDLGAVIGAAKGVGFYADMIGYGAASSGFTRGMGQFPMGVNYFMRTQTQCSNGADMWYYVPGIPEGTALGKRVAEAMQRLGLPGLRGLAPGMVEDAKAALDPSPVLNAVFGTGYAKCKKVTMPVGDYKGRLRSVEGKEWVRPLFPGDIQFRGGKPVQSRWVFDKWMTQEEFKKEYDMRQFCADGSTIVNHENNDCSRPLVGKKEGWMDLQNTSNASEYGVPVAVLLALGAVLYVRYSS